MSTHSILLHTRLMSSSLQRGSSPRDVTRLATMYGSQLESPLTWFLALEIQPMRKPRSP